MTEMSAGSGRRSISSRWLGLKEAILATAQPDGIRPRARRWLIAVFTLGFLVSVMALLVDHMLTMPKGHYQWNDSYVYLRAASNFIDHPTHLYDVAHVQVVRSWALRAFVYPPAGLLPSLPLVPIVRMFGMPVAASVWSLIDTVALFAGVILIGRRLRLSWLVLSGAVVLISLSQPVRWEIGSGQVNGLVLLMLMLSVLRMPRGDAGVLMGLALAIKPVTIFVLLVPVLRRQPAIAAVALVTLVLANVPFVPLIGIGAIMFYLGRVLPFFGSFVLHDPNNISLPNVLQTYFGGGQLPRHGLFGTSVPRSIASVALLWTTRASVIVVTLRAAIDRRLDVAIAMALAMATVPFLSATAWPHYLLYMLPMALALLASKQLWPRVGGALSLSALTWQGRTDGLWVGIVILWITAVLFVAGELGWRIPRPLKAVGTAGVSPGV